MVDIDDNFSPPVYSVSDLNGYIRALLESNENLMDIWVEGEISNLSRPRSGHIYFTLKDEDASVRCVVWRVNASRLTGSLQEGMLVEAHGYVSVYEGGGQYQLYVDGLRRAGEGRLYQQFLILKEKLTDEGLFDEDRKRPLPPLPKVIGVVTSPTGAAFQDMLNTLRSRFPLVEVVLSPASVQGAAAPEQIVCALEVLNRIVKPDVIIIGRGGGSLEDLWAFNDERVVRAVAASDTPVISGVGHETDFTLSDFSADLRAPTPTGAAVMAVPDINEFRTALQGWDGHLKQTVRTFLDGLGAALSMNRNRLEYASPERNIQQRMQHLDTVNFRFDRIRESFFSVQHQKLAIFDEKLAAFNPHLILGRGYALVEDGAGKPIRSVKQVKLGNDIHVNISDGIISADVSGIKEQEDGSGKEIKPD